MQTSIVLSNTSPLYYLNKLGILDILRLLFGELSIPEAVVNELQASNDFKIDLYGSYSSWITIERVNAIPPSISVIQGLGKGETEVLALAKIKKEPLLIIDDTLGRRIALSNGYSITGTCGILILAKNSCSASFPPLPVKKAFQVPLKHSRSCETDP
ncbi:MAG: hypothetical protein JXB88_02245 [Spirochaetales bacterium]|nr:hypothetical protein [Spirochaetales bacterium]